MLGSRPKAVIFDLDGTLIDSAYDCAVILNEVLKDENVSPFSAKELEKFMGDGIAATIEKALKSRGRTVSPERLEAFRHDYHERYTAEPVVDTKPFAHALDVLAKLAEQGIGVGVCTNKAEAPARRILDHTGLSAHISALVGGDSGYGMKPAAGPLRGCAGLLGVPADDVLYIGDLPVDVEAARAAGIRVLIVRYGYAQSDTTKFGADSTIGCLSELPAMLGS